MYFYPLLLKMVKARPEVITATKWRLESRLSDLSASAMNPSTILFPQVPSLPGSSKP